MSVKPRHLRPVWTVRDVAAELDFTEATVRAMLRRGEIHGVLLRGEWRVWKRDVDALREKPEPSPLARAIRAEKERARPSLARLANVVARGR